MKFLNVFASIFYLVLNAATQIISFKYFSKINLLRSILIGFLFGIVGLITVERYLILAAKTLDSDVILNSVTNLITYLALSYCYFNFINLGETARRIRILREIYDSKDGLSMEDILGRYNAKEIIDKRLARLLNNKQIIDKNGKYYIGKPTMLLISKIILLMKILILGKRSEFDHF